MTKKKQIKKPKIEKIENKIDWPRFKEWQSKTESPDTDAIFGLASVGSKIHFCADGEKGELTDMILAGILDAGIFNLMAIKMNEYSKSENESEREKNESSGD